MRFGRKGKLSSRYVGPLEILCIIGEVSYELTLPLNFVVVHLVLYISILRKYIPNLSHMLRWDSVQLDEQLTFLEESMLSLASDVRRLHT